MLTAQPIRPAQQRSSEAQAPDILRIAGSLMVFKACFAVDLKMYWLWTKYISVSIA